MSVTDRVTVTLPVELVDAIDRLERNRSRFIAEAVRRELERRRREALLQSLGAPHPETVDFVDGGVNEWAATVPPDDRLVDPAAGKEVRWVEGQGWVSG